MAGFFGENANNLHLVAATAIMAMSPMVVLFLALQNILSQGCPPGRSKAEKKREEFLLKKITFIGAGSTIFAKMYWGLLTD